MGQRYVIIGASAAGIAAAFKLRELDDQATITCITQEQELPYNKCLLADYLAGTKEASAVLIKQPHLFEEKRIILLLGTKVTEINPTQRFVATAGGEQIPYDKLLIATGGSMQRPALPGIYHSAVHDFYTFDDARRLLERVRANSDPRVVIIGAGLSGLECADSLLNNNVRNIVVIEREEHVLFRQIHQPAAAFIERKMEQARIQLRTGVTVDQVVAHDATHIKQIILSDGSTYPCDLLVCAWGARPQGLLARNAGLLIEHEALITDDYLRTNDPHIFAAGDCAIVTDLLTGQKVKSSSWPDAMQQGMTAAVNMAGGNKHYTGVITITSSAFFGVKFHSCGAIKKHWNEQLVDTQTNDAEFHAVGLHNKQVKSFVLLGNGRLFSSLKRSALSNHLWTGW